MNGTEKDEEKDQIDLPLSHSLTNNELIASADKSKILQLMTNPDESIPRACRTGEDSPTLREKNRDLCDDPTEVCHHNLSIISTLEN